MCLGMGWTVTEGAKLTARSVPLVHEVEIEDDLRKKEKGADALASSSSFRETWNDSF